MGRIRDLFVWAGQQAATAIWWAVVMTMLGGASVSSLFAGIGNGVRRGFSFGPITLIVVGLVGGLATLATFLLLRKQMLAARTALARLSSAPFPDLATIVADVRNHNERVAAARDAKPVNCARCGREVPKWFICPMPNETMSDRSFWLKTHPNLAWTPKEREGFITDGGIGCMVCAVTAPVYPADGETKEEFTKRVLSARSAGTSPPEGTSQ
jgi:hypothetical protein